MLPILSGVNNGVYDSLNGFFVMSSYICSLSVLPAVTMNIFFEISLLYPLFNVFIESVTVNDVVAVILVIVTSFGLV